MNELLLDFARTADDRELVRINPKRFAEQHGLTTGEAIDLSLHARRRGDVIMEWQYVCPGCGACLAVTLNDRLDYFGQTVNIAARVQALAAADEIVVTEDVLLLPGARELVAGLDLDSGTVELKGIAGEVRVHRLRAAVL